MAADLFADEVEQERFADHVLKRTPYRPALIWLDERPAEMPFRLEKKLSWQPDFVDRVKRDQRPGQDDLHDAGSYYCMALSSVFESCTFGIVPQNPDLVVDLCAAPGGKSIFANRLLQPEMILANDIVRKRRGLLISNFKRCRIRPSMITSQDPRVVAEHCGAAADLVIVDAPCSGQSLIAKGKQVSSCFHSHIINNNRNRQRRIMANAAKIVKPGGWIAYFTCTYAEKENEGIVKWMRVKFPEFENVEIPWLSEFQSHLSEFPCYRLWPQQGLGPGGFAAMFRRPDERAESWFDSDLLHPSWTSAWQESLESSQSDS